MVRKEIGNWIFFIKASFEGFGPKSGSIMSSRTGVHEYIIDGSQMEEHKVDFEHSTMNAQLMKGWLKV